MSFDGAKVRRFLIPDKHFKQIVCDNSRFVDKGQINIRNCIFLLFRTKPALIWIKIRTFAAQTKTVFSSMDKTKNRYLSVVYQLYTVTDGKKNLEEQTGEEHPFQLITGYGIALDAFEEQIASKEKGELFDFTLEPEEAFGVYEPEGAHKLDRSVFMIDGKFDQERVFEGAIIPMSDQDGHHFMAKVTKIEADSVTIDTNHPLAGKTLNFTGKVLENREATEQEINSLIKHLTGGCGGCGGGCGNHEGGSCNNKHEGGCGDGCCGNCQ